MEQPITLEAARPQIVRFLTYDQVRDLLEKLRSKSKVEMLVKADATNRPVPPADAPKAAPAPPAATPPAKAEKK
jgi:peptidyl-prolyl cis-trans isomerase C